MGERKGTKGLELWCRRMTEGYPGVNVVNMTTSWRDGLAFCAIIHHFRPDLIEFSKLNKDDIYYNNELAFRTAERHLGIPALLEPEDMVDFPVPDRLSILTYLSQFYQTFVVSQGKSPTRIPAKRPPTSPEHSIVSPASSSPPTKVAFSGARVRREPCARCDLPVFIAERLNVGKLLYHRTCFRCARCDSQLTLANYYKTEGDEYCCETCPDEEKTVVQSSVLCRSVSDEEKSATLKNEDEVRELPFAKARSFFLGLDEEEPPDLPETEPPNIADVSCETFDDSGLDKKTVQSSISGSRPEVHDSVTKDVERVSLVQARMRLFEKETRDINQVPLDESRSEDSAIIEETPEDDVHVASKLPEDDVQVAPPGGDSPTREVSPPPPEDDIREPPPPEDDVHESPPGADGDYPEDLDPFRDDSTTNPFEDDETNPFAETPRKRIEPSTEDRNISPLYNPFDEPPQPARRRVKAFEVTLNPFWSDDEDNEEKPVPKPRLSKTPEVKPRESGLSLSSASSGASGYTLKKKKPAPKPPESGASSLTSSPSQSVTHSPRSTPKIRKAKKAPLPPTSTPLTGAPSFDVDVTNDDFEQDKIIKDEQNRNRQSQNLQSPSSSEASVSLGAPDKSTYGKWKRKKGQAPDRPIPQRRMIKSLPMADIRRELELIEVQQQGLEKQGVRLERMIREKCEGPGVNPDSSLGSDVEDMILQLFELVNEKNALFRNQATLMYLRRQHKLEEEHADIEYQIRCLMLQPEANKTDLDKAREEELISRLVEVVERRNEIIECLEMDRLREAEEDDGINSQLSLYNMKKEEDKNAGKESKKEKKKQKKEKKKKGQKIDADKDIDESESAASPVKEKKKTKFYLF